MDPPAHGDDPFSTAGIVRDDRGVARRTDLPSSLVELLHAAVDAHPNGEALVEFGQRAAMGSAARIVGGLEACGVARG